MITRVTGILLKENTILLLEQVAQQRSWSLPGGTVEEGESLKEALVREMKEETGLDTRVKELVYVCDFIREDKHVIHISFMLESLGGDFSERDTTIDTNKIKSLKFVACNQLSQYGFSKKFQQIVLDDFPQKGSYRGDKSNIGL